MKRRFLTLITVALLSVFMFSSCVGSFSLTNRVLAWNKSITNSKFVNGIIYLPMLIAYSVTMVVDGLVLNTIEFWTDKNPMRAGLVKEIQGEDGILYTVETLKDGYNIKNDKGEEMNLIFDERTRTWSAHSGDVVTELMTINEDETATVYINGVSYEVELSEAGVTAFQEFMKDDSVLYVANNF